MKRIIYSAVLVFLMAAALSAAEEVLYPKQTVQVSPALTQEAAPENTPTETADDEKKPETGEEADMSPEKDGADETETESNEKEIEEKKITVPGIISFDNNEPDVVVLKWTDPGMERVYYNVFRKKSEDEDFILLNKEPFAGTEYRDEEIEFETEYVYYLEVINEEGEKESSKEFSFITKKLNLPLVPRGFKTYQDVEKVVLRWSGSSPGTFPLSGYNIYRGRTPGNPEFLKFIEKTETAYTDEDVEPAIKYYYAMSAVDDRGNESLTTELSEVVPFPKSRTGLILMPTAYRNNIKDNLGFNADVYFNYYIGSIYGEYDTMVYGEGTDTFGKIGLWILTADMKFTAVNEYEKYPSVGLGWMVSMMIRDSLGGSSETTGGSVQLSESQFSDSLSVAHSLYGVLSKKIINETFVHAGYMAGLGDPERYDDPEDAAGTKNIWQTPGVTMFFPHLTSYKQDKNDYSDTAYFLGINTTIFGDTGIKMEYIVPVTINNNMLLPEQYIINTYIDRFLNFNFSYYKYDEGYAWLGYIAFRFSVYPNPYK